MAATDVCISEADIECFQRDGAVCLKNAFSPDWIEKVIAGIDKNKQIPSRYSENLRATGGPGYYFNDYCNWQNIPEFNDFVLNSPAAAIAGQLMQSEYSVFYHEHVLTKDPGTFKETPWHHDQAYYPIDGIQNCSIWMPVDPVSLDTTIQFVKGSHRWGKWFRPRKFATLQNYAISDNDFEEKSFEDVPFENIEAGQYDILSFETKPGDCVVFHMMTLHGAPANKSNTPRRVLSTRWLGADAVLARRPWEVSPPILGGLNIGNPVCSDTFPKIWVR